jgi:hypothetical protein
MAAADLPPPGAKWWLEKMTLDPREEIEIEVGDERGDFFL